MERGGDEQREGKRHFNCRRHGQFYVDSTRTMNGSAGGTAGGETCETEEAVG